MCHRFSWRCPAALLFLTLTVFAAGCTERSVPVEGQLNWDDGKPVARANLRFVPLTGTKEAVASTDEKGAFTLSSIDGPGAPAGDYKVVVTKTSSIAGPAIKDEPPKSGEDMIKNMKGFGEKVAKSGSKAPQIKDPIPTIYTVDTSTPLTCKVEPGKKIELTIKRQ
jgi:hypothetical protein